MPVVIGDLLPSAPRIEHSDREVALIRSAYRTMSRLGTERLSLREVAQDAGVSPPLLVYHFGGKDELLLATMRWALVSTVNRIRRRLDGITDAQEALAELMDAVFVVRARTATSTSSISTWCNIRSGARRSVVSPRCSGSR